MNHVAKAPSKGVSRIQSSVKKASKKLNKISSTPVEPESLMNSQGQLSGLGTFNPFGFPQNQGFPGTEPVESVNTIFKNLRWYLVSNFRQVLSQLFVEVPLVQTICMVPVQDALRGGIEIKSKQLDESQIEDLQISFDRDNDLNTAGETVVWNRLFGGAGIIILTDQDPMEPLDLKMIGPNTPLEFRSCDMWELFFNYQNSDGYDPTVQMQEYEYFDYYGEKVHKSRVMMMKGMEAPSFIRPRLRGWGFSVVEGLVRSLNQYLKATDLGFEVLDEFKIDVYKVKNLVNVLMSPNGKEAVHRRVTETNWMKNYQNAILLDSEDDYIQKQLSFAGLAEAMEGIRIQVASDMRMPMIKLFGTPTPGLGSNDDSSIEVYHDMVESQVRNKLKYDILRMAEIKCQKLFGFIPDDMSITFKPLKSLSAEQEENVKTQKFNRLQMAADSGRITQVQWIDACNKGNLFDISLDNAGDVLNPNDPQARAIVKEGTNDPLDPVDVQNPASGRADTPKPKASGFGGIPKGRVKPQDEDSIENEYVKAGRLLKAVLSKQKSFQPYTPIQRIDRILKNTSEFDKASYEADGGDSWVNPQRLILIKELHHENPGLWAQCEAESMKIFSRINLAFVYWLYKKRNGSSR